MLAHYALDSPTCSKKFTLSIVEYRPNQTSYVTAYSEVDTSVMYVKANRTGQTGEAFFFILLCH